MPGFPAERLLRKGFRLLFGGRSEVNGGQKGTDQHDEQVDFHVALRCAVAATGGNAKGVPIVPLSNDSGAIKNG